jgi:hypothetical protein
MGKARFNSIPLAMKLFRRSDDPPRKAGENAAGVEPALPEILPAPREISLSTEQKSILEEPVDPRVDIILQGIYGDKTAAEQAMNASRNSGKRHVIQDQSGLWRIVPDPVPQEPISLLGAL